MHVALSLHCGTVDTADPQTGEIGRKKQNQKQEKVKVKGVGQECPTHTSFLATLLV
jgi:hypothetical protein